MSLTLPSLFTLFSTDIKGYTLPQKFTYPYAYTPHPLCLLAAKELQAYLLSQTHWPHNFGLVKGKQGRVIGKMFGVLLVEAPNKEIGYLSAFSGKMGGSNHYERLVPPVFDGLTEGSFLNKGMTEITQVNQKIQGLNERGMPSDLQEIKRLKQYRYDLSNSIQEKIFDHYHFLNIKGESKSLRTLFQDLPTKNPPGGTGECAAPKLLQYAFKHHLKPLALAEFWWGLSPKSKHWKHGHFYPVCLDKCAPLLVHMLEGIEVAKNPVS